MMHFSVGTHFRVVGNLGITLSGLLPVIPLSIESEGGEAVLRFGQIGLGPRLTFGGGKAIWLPSVGAGVNVLVTHVVAEADQGYDSNNEWVFGVAPYLSGGLSVVLHERVRLRVDAMVEWSVSRTEVRFAGREVASWGHMVVIGTLGIELFLW